MREKIREILRDRILRGHYRPGDRLVEQEIAQEMQSSQIPVREALRELQAMRLVTSECYKGCCVRSVSPREMQEAYQVRAALEDACSATAAANIRENPQPLWDLFERLLRAAKAEDRTEFARTNQEFHHTIVVAGGNELLQQIWESLSFDVRTLGNVARTSQPLVELAEEHRPIVEALAAGDGAQAGMLLKAHARSVGTRAVAKGDLTHAEHA